MLDTTGLSREEERAFIETYNHIGECFNIQVDSEFSVPIEQFELFKEYSRIYFRDAFNIREGREKSYLGFIQVEYTYSGDKGSNMIGTEYQIWAIARLPGDFGHLAIKRETLRDKVVEFLQPLEIDFPEDKEFCKRFYVVTKDQDKARELLTEEFISELQQILVRDFYLEVLNDYLIIGNKKVLGTKEARALANFVYNISELSFR